MILIRVNSPERLSIPYLLQLLSYTINSPLAIFQHSEPFAVLNNSEECFCQHTNLVNHIKITKGFLQPPHLRKKTLCNHQLSVQPTRMWLSFLMGLKVPHFLRHIFPVNSNTFWYWNLASQTLGTRSRPWCPLVFHCQRKTPSYKKFKKNLILFVAFVLINIYYFLLENHFPNKLTIIFSIHLEILLPPRMFLTVCRLYHHYSSTIFHRHSHLYLLPALTLYLLHVTLNVFPVNSKIVTRKSSCVLYQTAW